MPWCDIAASLRMKANHRKQNHENLRMANQDSRKAALSPYSRVSTQEPCTTYSLPISEVWWHMANSIAYPNLNFHLLPPKFFTQAELGQTGGYTKLPDRCVLQQLQIQNKSVVFPLPKKSFLYLFPSSPYTVWGCTEIIRRFRSNMSYTIWKVACDIGSGTTVRNTGKQLLHSQTIHSKV